MAASTFCMSLMVFSNAQLSKGLEREVCEKGLVIELLLLHLECCLVANLEGKILQDAVCLHANSHLPYWFKHAHE